ncbi:hypothetical protein M8J76_004625 [Diaphorina citri]|nr:hypothetical protein M8J76_004625 [Diaphorina citri]
MSKLEISISLDVSEVKCPQAIDVLKKFLMDSNSSLIQKHILHAGKEYKEIKDGSKVHFHFVTQLCDSDNTILDDSRKLGKPMQLVLGKKFKLEVWETLVKHMSIGEISKFVCDKSVSLSY